MAITAQDLPALRPFVAYELGVPLTLERSPNTVDWCSTCIGTGTSLNHTVRVGTSLLFPRLLSESLSTDGRLTLSLSSGEFLSDPYSTPLINPNTNETQQVQQQFTVTAFSASVTLDLLAKKGIGRGVVAAIGPWGDYRLFSRFVQTEQLLAPDDARFFEDSARSRVVAEGDILGSSSFSGGILLGLSVSIPLSSRTEIVPELYTRVDGWGVLNGLGFRAFNSGVALTLRLKEAKEPQTPPQLSVAAPQPPPPPVPPALSAQVDLYAINANNQRGDTGILRPSTTLIRRHTPPIKEILLRDFIVPEIGVAPEITAQAGVMWWGLSIRRGKTEIARITSEEPTMSIDLDIQITEGEDVPTLNAELIVQDSTERIVGARDQLIFIAEDSQSRATFTPNTFYNTVEDQWQFTLPLPSLTASSDWLDEVVDSANIEGAVITITSANTDSMNAEQTAEAIDRVVAYLRTEKHSGDPY